MSIPAWIILAILLGWFLNGFLGAIYGLGILAGVFFIVVIFWWIVVRVAIKFFTGK